MPTPTSTWRQLVDYVLQYVQTTLLCQQPKQDPLTIEDRYQRLKESDHPVKQKAAPIFIEMMLEDGYELSWHHCELPEDHPAVDIPFLERTWVKNAVKQAYERRKLVGSEDRMGFMPAGLGGVMGSAVGGRVSSAVGGPATNAQKRRRRSIRRIQNNLSNA